MSTDFIIRLIGMVIFSVLGVAWGTALGRAANEFPTTNTLTVDTLAHHTTDPRHTQSAWTNLCPNPACRLDGANSRFDHRRIAGISAFAAAHPIW